MGNKYAMGIKKDGDLITVRSQSDLDVIIKKPPATMKIFLCRSINSFGSTGDLSQSGVLSALPQPPKLLVARWQITETELGHGAFGKVFLGMNSDTGELIAVKQVNISAFPQNDPVRTSSLPPYSFPFPPSLSFPFPSLSPFPFPFPPSLLSLSLSLPLSPFPFPIPPFFVCLLSLSLPLSLLSLSLLSLSLPSASLSLLFPSFPLFLFSPPFFPPPPSFSLPCLPSLYAISPIPLLYFSCYCLAICHFLPFSHLLLSLPPSNHLLDRKSP